ncbi:MAG TPA: hypothetical protein ENK17_03000 [Anaerolineae bacterium]|nr:hypothetical protein [Anaerolineae bacterium]
MSAKIKLHWPVDDRTITQYFGENPQLYAQYHQPGHEGLDFRAPLGANIYACADGEVFAIRPNDGNAYGLHVRLRHFVDGLEYRTIYAHLSKVLVSVGQQVKAGELIALAGNTGHSFGPHLHLTLKLVGAQTPGYPPGVIDPLPYLEEPQLPPPSDLLVHPTVRLRLRSGPTTASTHLLWLDPGEPLTVLGDAEAARSKIGQMGEWLQVQRADGMHGYVAAWYVQLHPEVPEQPEEPEEPEPSGPLTVYATEALNVRRGPSTGTSRIAIALPDEPLEVLDDRETALEVLGDRGKWLRVRLPYGLRGYVAAWYVTTEPGQPVGPLLTVYPTQDMNMRERPTVRAKRIGRPAHNTPLTVHDDPSRARGLVGRYDEWLYVQTPEGQWGWVAAWYVSTTPT